MQKKTFVFTKMSLFVQIATHSFNFEFCTGKLKGIWLWIVKHFCNINQVHWYLCLDVLIILILYSSHTTEPWRTQRQSEGTQECFLFIYLFVCESPLEYIPLTKALPYNPRDVFILKAS